MFMARADADNRGLFAKRPELPAAVDELSELVRLAMHRQLVVGQTQAAQDAEPLAVVPFRRVGQLAELRVLGHSGRSAVELVGQGEGAEHAGTRLSGRERRRVMAKAAVIGGPAQQARVGCADKPFVGPRLVGRGVPRDRRARASFQARRMALNSGEESSRDSIARR